MSLKRASKGSNEPKLVWWPVTIFEPKDGGRSIQHLVKVQYEILEEDDRDQAVGPGDREFLERVVKDWKDFVEDDNTQIPCTEESRAEFFNISWVKIAVVQGYFLASAGGRRKN